MSRGKGRRSLSKYAFASDEETEYVLDQLAQEKDVEGIAARVGLPVEAVEDIRASFYPTTKLATMYLRSHALTLAKRIVADANVKESVDLLERPAMGVVDVVPRGKQGDVNVGFFTSINPHTLGGVNSAVPVPVPTSHVGPRPINVRPSLPPYDIERGVSDALPVNETVAVHAQPTSDDRGEVGRGISGQPAVHGVGRGTGQSPSRAASPFPSLAESDGERRTVDVPRPRPRQARTGRPRRDAAHRNSRPAARRRR